MLAWQDYHHQHATLFLTDAHANMRKGKTKSFRSHARDEQDLASSAKTKGT
jgi:hypothetical protein